MQTRKYRRTVKKGGMDKISKLVSSIQELVYPSNVTKSARTSRKKRGSQKHGAKKPLTSKEREQELLDKTISEVGHFMEADKKEREAAKKQREEAEKNAKLEQAKLKAIEGNRRKAEEEAKKAAAKEAEKKAKIAAEEDAKKAKIAAEEDAKKKAREEAEKKAREEAEKEATEEKHLLDNILNAIVENQPITEVLKPAFINKHHLLHLAVEKNSTVSLQSLLQFRPKIDVFDNDGKTPVEIAIQNENHELVRFLVENGASLKKNKMDSETFSIILQTKTKNLDVSWIDDENICSHITKVFPTFATKSYEKQYCIVFLLIAMLTQAYEEFCTIVIKGGKAIQLNFSAVPYPSDDIDVIIIPKYDSVDCKIIAQEAARFIETATGFSILDVPAPSNIMKISYKSPEKYIALADIGYGYNELKPELREKLYKDFKTKKLGGFGSINYLPSGNLILEKLYYIYAYSASSPLFKLQSAEVSDNIEVSENIAYIRVTNEKIDKQNTIVASLEKYKKTKTMDDVLLNTSDDYKELFVNATPKQIDGLIKQKHDNINDNMKGNMEKGGKIKGINVASQEIQNKIGKQFSLVQLAYMSQKYCVINNPEHISQNYCVNNNPEQLVDIGNNHFLEKSREQMLKLAGILNGGKVDREVMLRQFVDHYYSVFGFERDEMMDTLILHSIVHHEWLKPAIYRKPSNGEPYLFRP
jgi:hypothetical protein